MITEFFSLWALIGSLITISVIIVLSSTDNFPD